MPTLVQNSVSLFSWLLVATGLFTFTLLYLFLRRKPLILIGTQLPNMPATKAYSTLTSSPSEPTQPKLTTQEPQPTVARANVAMENLNQAPMTTQIPAIYETWQSQTQLEQDSQNRQQPKPSKMTEPVQAITNHLSKISETGKKVKDLEAALMVERGQLNKEITDLNNVLEEQERAVKSYFDSIRQAVMVVSTQTTEVNEKHEANSAEVNFNQNPTEKKEDRTQSIQEIEQSNTAQNSTVNPQVLLVNNKQDNQLTEFENKRNQQQPGISNKQNAPPMQQNIVVDENVKKTRTKNRRQERTQEEDIRIAEHTKDD
jgi:hypothetical protein